jgi:hypothetical protein
MFVHHNSDFLSVCASDCVQRKTEKIEKERVIKFKTKKGTEETGKRERRREIERRNKFRKK